jgi:hypothetical protein
MGCSGWEVITFYHWLFLEGTLELIEDSWEVIVVIMHSHQWLLKARVSIALSAA